LTVLANSSNPGNVFNAETADDVVDVSVAPVVEEAMVVAASEIVVELPASSVDVEEIALLDGAHAANNKPPSPRPPSRKALRRSRTCSCS
jgi:hypothetical protein